MNTQEIRKAYLEFFEKRGHKVIPRASLVPQDDPTTLFTGSGMQPMIPYLLGEPHHEGSRIADSQACFRAEDMDEVGDNRHTTFFEMLGNWSLGDYFKAEQLPWFFEFLTNVVGLDPNNIYISAFIGDPNYDIPKDTETAGIWKELFEAKGIEAKDVEGFFIMILKRTGGAGRAYRTICQRENQAGRTAKSFMILACRTMRNSAKIAIRRVTADDSWKLATAYL
jgi:alanyl-tRNA synthetase